MRTFALALACALCYTANAQAQVATEVADANVTSPVPAPSDGPDHCIMAPETTWQSLGLTADQMTKVKDLQLRCSAVKDKPEADMTEHEKELATILTPEQHASYQKWCQENGPAPSK